MTKRVIIFSLFIAGLIFVLAYTPADHDLFKKVRKQDSGLTVEEYLKKVGSKDKLVFVYFNADWCVPCIKLKPVIQELDAEESQNIILLKLDVDDNPKVSTYLEINSLPLFMIYKNGKSVWTHTGMLTKAEMKYQIELLQTK